MSSSSSVSVETIDAISRLPFELLGQIFIYCLPTQPGDPSFIYAPLLLCHVSSTWRATAFALPQLWDTLSFSFSSQKDELSRLAYVNSAVKLAGLWFANISNSTLSLSLSWYGPSGLRPLEDIIILNSTRLHKLSLSLNFDIDFVHFFSLSPGYLDNLEYLSLLIMYLYGPNLVEMPAFQSLPRLRKVVISGIRENWVDWSASSQIPLPWSQLTHLDIRTPLSSTMWRALLSQCKSLKHCFLDINFDLARNAGAATVQQLILPSLIDLTVSVTDDVLGDCDNWFRSVAFPMLEELEMRYAEFTPMLSGFLPLSSLRRLALMDTTIDTHTMVSLVRATTALTELILWLEPEPDSGPDILPLWDTLTCPPDESSYRVLPHLKVLELWLTCYEYDTETLPSCAAVIKSRWRPACSHVACLQRVALHFPYRGLGKLEEAESLLRHEVFDGLDIQIDTQSFTNYRSERCDDIFELKKI